MVCQPNPGGACCPARAGRGVPYPSRSRSRKALSEVYGPDFVASSQIDIHVMSNSQAIVLVGPDDVVQEVLRALKLLDRKQLKFAPKPETL